MLKKIIENWCRKTLQLECLSLLHRINKKHKKIIFTFASAVIFKHFAGSKERLAIIILTKYYGYSVYEQQLCLWIPQKERITHTYGEIIDIIRAAKQIPFPIKPLLPHSKLQNP